MPVVSELYGFKVGKGNPSLPANLNADCPYSGRICDGGGNRDMASLKSVDDAGVRARFSKEALKRDVISCGICTIAMGGDDWIICPRRLFSLTGDGKQAKLGEKHDNIIKTICALSGIKSGSEVSVWSELSLRHKTEGSSFNYRLDYLVRQKTGDDYGLPIIIEVMTCSTSGGNKNEGTDISTAFRKSLLTNGISDVQSPGVNLRQVWARMASQLIVKAELSIKWGGRTVWVIQDKLANYINNQTGLDLDYFRSEVLGEVNIISVNSDLSSINLYSGPISNSSDGKKGFIDILRSPTLPDLTALDFGESKHFLGRSTI